MIHKSPVSSFWHCNSLKPPSFHLKPPHMSVCFPCAYSLPQDLAIYVPTPSYVCQSVRYRGIQNHSVLTPMCSGHKCSSLSGPTSITETSRGEIALLENTTLIINACSSVSLESFVIKSELQNPVSMSQGKFCREVQFCFHHFHLQVYFTLWLLMIRINVLQEHFVGMLCF